MRKKTEFKSSTGQHPEVEEIQHICDISGGNASTKSICNKLHGNKKQASRVKK